MTIKKGALHPASPFAPAWVSDNPNHLGILPDPCCTFQLHPEAKHLNRNILFLVNVHALPILNILLALKSRQSLHFL